MQSHYEIKFYGKIKRKFQGKIYKLIHPKEVDLKGKFWSASTYTIFNFDKFDFYVRPSVFAVYSRSDTSLSGLIMKYRASQRFGNLRANINTLCKFPNLWEAL